MNESYRLGEQLIIAYLQRLANGISTAELDVAALPAELRAVGEQLQKTHAILQQERRLLERNAYIDPLILTSTISSIAMIGLATPKAIAIF